MAAGKFDITIEQGSDFSLSLNIKDNGVYRNLTGWSSRAQIRKRPSDITEAASFVCTIPTPLEGEVVMSIPNAATRTIPSGNYFYDLEIFTAADAEVLRILEGKVTVTPEITK